MNRPSRAIIVDDERLARRKLRTLLEEEGVEVIAECANGRDSVAQIRHSRPDLLFLDVELPDLDGFEILHHVGPENLRVMLDSVTQVFDLPTLRSVALSEYLYH